MNGNAPALKKGLAILEYVLSINEPVTLSRMAENTGYKVSEIQRMVDYLARDDFLVKTAAGSYIPGARAFHLAARKLDNAVISRSEGPMLRYAAGSGCSIHLGLLVEDNLHIVYQVDSPGEIQIGVRPGLYKADDYPSGRLLLSYRSEKTQEDREDFKTIRSQGYSFGEVRCALGLYVIAVPISIAGNPCVASLASLYFLSKKDSDLFREDILAKLQSCSKEISGLF